MNAWKGIRRSRKEKTKMINKRRKNERRKDGRSTYVERVPAGTSVEIEELVGLDGQSSFQAVVA